MGRRRRIEREEAWNAEASCPSPHLLLPLYIAVPGGDDKVRRSRSGWIGVVMEDGAAAGFNAIHTLATGFRFGIHSAHRPDLFASSGACYGEGRPRAKRQQRLR
jgi:hypothetical protein